MIEITQQAIDVDAVLQSVQDDRCGASVLFLGTTRSETGGAITQSLEYECYQSMAIRLLEELAEEARRRWSIPHCAIVHRVGLVGIGQVSVAVAVSAPHRGDAFAAGQWLIDSIKSSIPIWKKERWADGTVEWQHPQAGTQKVSRAVSP